MIISYVSHSNARGTFTHFPVRNGDVVIEVVIGRVMRPVLSGSRIAKEGDDVRRWCKKKKKKNK